VERPGNEGRAVNNFPGGRGKALRFQTPVDETVQQVYPSSMDPPFTGSQVDAPIHDWTVRIGSGSYGVVSWVPGHWDVYVRSYVEPGASVGVQYAAVILPALLLGIAACKIAISMLRVTVKWRRAH
jgi:hypothetical protein